MRARQASSACRRGDTPRALHGSASWQRPAAGNSHCRAVTAWTRSHCWWLQWLVEVTWTCVCIMGIMDISPGYRYGSRQGCALPAVAGASWKREWRGVRRRPGGRTRQHQGCPTDRHTGNKACTGQTHTRNRKPQASGVQGTRARDMPPLARDGSCPAWRGANKKGLAA